MKFSKLVILLVVALLFVVGPVVNISWAADGTGQEVANNAEGWLNAVLIIGAIILALAGVIFLLLVGGQVYGWLAKKLPKIDASRNILAFGNSVPGRAVNDALGRLLPQVDEPTDPFIRRAQSLPLLKQLHEWGVIDGATFSDLVSRVVADGIKLTNGVPDVKFDLLGFDSTAAKG